MKTRLLTRELAVLLFITAFFISFSLPIITKGTDSWRMVTVFSSDESTIMDLVENIFARKHLYLAGLRRYREGNYDYGMTYYWPILFGIWLYRILTTNPLSGQLIITTARLWSVVAGIISAWFLYLLAKELYDYKVGLLACVLLLSTPEFLVWSTMAHPDIPQILLMEICILYCVFMVKNYQRKHVIWAAAAAGLAFGTKYSGLMLIPIIWLAQIIGLLRLKGPEARLELKRQLFLSTVIFSVAFAVTNPYFFITPKMYLGAIHRQSVRSSFGHLFKGEGGWYLWLPVLYSDHLLSKGGGILFLLSLGLLTPCVLKKLAENRLNSGLDKKKRPNRLQIEEGAGTENKTLQLQDKLRQKFINLSRFLVDLPPVIIPLCWIFLYGGFLFFRVVVREFRYILPIIPFMLIFASRAAWYFISGAGYSGIRRHLIGVTGIVLIIAAVWPRTVTAYKYYNNSLNKLENNVYIEAGEWVAANFPPDTKVIADFYSYVPPKIKKMNIKHFYHEWRVKKINPDLIIINDKTSGTYINLTKAKADQSRYPEDFYLASLFYGKLQREELGYKLIKDFGKVKIYAREGIEPLSPDYP